MWAIHQAQGADELVFLDISASAEGKATMVSVVRAVAAVLSIPFTVGGGVRTLADAQALLEAGADKVSVNTAAVQNPTLITDIATRFGAQCCVLAVDARKRPGTPPEPTGNAWEVLTHGGRAATHLDALAWAVEAVDRGAGEILLTSWDKDGTLDGFDCPMTRTFATRLSVPVIASGGASGPESFVTVFGLEGCADAALAASIFHDGTWTVQQLKAELARHGIPVAQHPPPPPTPS
jgi:imidazole glycerol-phosphate synthase subunit HisF